MVLSGGHQREMLDLETERASLPLPQPVTKSAAAPVPNRDPEPWPRGPDVRPFAH
jgi:hypothetical protein